MNFDLEGTVEKFMIGLAVVAFVFFAIGSWLF
jgi:hypothetical protein